MLCMASQVHCQWSYLVVSKCLFYWLLFDGRSFLLSFVLCIYNFLTYEEFSSFELWWKVVSLVIILLYFYKNTCVKQDQITFPEHLRPPPPLTPLHPHCLVGLLLLCLYYSFCCFIMLFVFETFWFSLYMALSCCFRLKI